MAEGRNLAGDASNAVTFDRVEPIRVAPAPAGFDQTSLMLMGAAARSVADRGRAGGDPRRSRVRYANERVAFERPIGKFQAVQHNLARLAGEVGGRHDGVRLGGRRDRASRTRSTTRCSSRPPSAKIRSAEAAEEGAAIAHQVHGAIGFTSEHVLHRFTLRLLGLARRLRQ